MLYYAQGRVDLNYNRQKRNGGWNHSLAITEIKKTSPSCSCLTLPHRGHGNGNPALAARRPLHNRQKVESPSQVLACITFSVGAMLSSVEPLAHRPTDATGWSLEWRAAAAGCRKITPTTVLKCNFDRRGRKGSEDDALNNEHRIGCSAPNS